MGEQEQTDSNIMVRKVLFSMFEYDSLFVGSCVPIFQDG